MADDAIMLTPSVGANDQLTQLQTYFVNAKVRLTKDVPPTDPTTLVAALIAMEADYTGYAGKVVPAFSGPFDQPNGEAAILGTLLNFSPTGTAVVNTIKGGWVESAAGVLEFTFALAAPKALNGPTDVLSLVVEPRLPGPGVVHQLD